MPRALCIAINILLLIGFVLLIVMAAQDFGGVR
jgi:hypothetical protein